MTSQKATALVDTAYRKLKQDVYYDKLNLFLRFRIAKFESSPEFEKKMGILADVIRHLDSDDTAQKNRYINKWVNSIDFYCLPKPIKDDKGDNNNDQGKSTFITNMRTSKEYNVENVNYFISAPVELHILDVLWSITIGDKLDQELSDNCLASRLVRDSEGKLSSESSGLFKIYYKQYEKWRDNAISLAETALNNKTNIIIIALDIKQCFYHLNTNWKEIRKLTKVPLELNLCEVIQEVHKKYHNVLTSYIKVTHIAAKGSIGLPIGLTSSCVISNWILDKFDQYVGRKLDPLYYGRYVDDILFVVQPPNPNNIDNSDQIINDVLVLKKLLIKQTNNEYALTCLPELKIQQDKVLIQYFDYKHSHAGLKQFKRELKAQASEFRFLPEEDSYQHGLDHCAYDIIYKGSLNKLRSVVGLEENATELSIYFSRQLIQYWLCKDGLKEDHIKQLFRFYQGKNVFDFLSLWGKVFTLLILNNQESDCAKFYELCLNMINKLDHRDTALKEKIIQDLKEYLCLALAIPIGLRSKEFNPKSKTLSNYIDDRFAAISFRDSNLIRHQFVSYPLINYTKYDGDLTVFNHARFDNSLKKLSEFRLKYTPRYIHSDERQLHALLECLATSKKHDDEKTTTEKLLESTKLNFTPESDAISIASNDITNIPLCVGIANMKIDDENITRGFTPHKTPELSFTRQSKLFELLNESIKKPKCDILVLPEVSIPVAWLVLHGDVKWQ